MAGDRSKGMNPAEPFTFGIALVSRRSAGDRVRALLDRTLASLQGQTDPDFKVVIAGHERSRFPDDRRISRGLAVRFGLTLARIRGGARGGLRTHKRHEASPQGVVV
jgi:hypothetical protein